MITNATSPKFNSLDLSSNFHADSWKEENELTKIAKFISEVTLLGQGLRDSTTTTTYFGLIRTESHADLIVKGDTLELGKRYSKKLTIFQRVWRRIVGRSKTEQEEYEILASKIEKLFSNSIAVAKMTVANEHKDNTNFELSKIFSAPTELDPHPNTVNNFKIALSTIHQHASKIKAYDINEKVQWHYQLFNHAFSTTAEFD